jgi:2-iminobutanoate/2-iminopropanoate deaminase
VRKSALLYSGSNSIKGIVAIMITEISTPTAPKAIGPYNQALLAQGLIYTSGQIAINPDTNQFEAGTIEQQTEQVLKNLRAILESVGGSLEKALKATVYLRDMKDFEAMNKVYGSFFANHKPARTTIAVVGLPKDALIEIDLVALA